MLKFGSKNDVNTSYNCTIRLLDDSEIIECEIQAHHKGSFLLDYVCQQLNLDEKDYFGLRYVDIGRQRHWLDQGKTVLKQIKDLDGILFSFRVKFYPPDPFRLKEEITRYQIYLQLKRDLLHGRLYCSQSDAALLAAYIVQAELGDYDPDEHTGNYISDLKILLKQTEQIEERVMDLHKTQLKGQTPTEAESAFLQKACQLDTYGVDPHPVKDHRGNTLYLGINHLGILTFQGSRKTHHFSWSEVQKINYEGKMFIIHLVYHEDPRTKKKHTVGFKCSSGSACRHVWRCAVEQMLFFTLAKAKDAPVMSGGGLFSFGSRFKYAGRTERELLEETAAMATVAASVEGDDADGGNSEGGTSAATGRRPEPKVQRVFSLRQHRRKASSVPATPSTPLGSDIISAVNNADSASVRELTHTDGFLRQQQKISSLNGLSSAATTAPNLLHAPNLKDLQDGSNEYNFRDSFDLSVSSDMDQQQQQQSHRSSRSATPQPPAARISTTNNLPVASNSLLLPSTVISAGNATAATSHLNPLTLQSKQEVRKFNVIKVFVPAFLLVTSSLLVMAVLVLESNLDILAGLRHTPELMAFRRDVYLPIKDTLSRTLRALWPARS